MSRSVYRLACLGAFIAVVAILGPHTAAQDPPAKDPASASESTEAPEPGQSGEGSRRQLETFEPSEKVPADSAVAFPVDI